MPAGTRFTRPGVEWFAPVDQVDAACPPPDAAERLVAGDVPRHRRSGRGVRRHDHPARVGRDVLRAVDLDLDVVRGPTGRVWVDDEDEFAEHQVAFDYPDDVVSGDGGVLGAARLL